MSNYQIHYIATKTILVDTLRGYCTKQGIDLIPYEYDIIGNIRYLFIIEPVKIGADLFSLSTIWKPWLMDQWPEIKLFFGGYVQSKHPNYINLLELPDSLKERLENGHPVSAYPLQKAGTEVRNGQKHDKYDDPWNRFLPLTGRDMKKQIQKFVNGHDHSNSFLVQVSKLRQALVDIRFLILESQKDNTVNTGIEDDLKMLRDTAEKEWNDLVVRWNFYKEHFDWMPFKHTTDRMNMIMNELNVTMSDVNNLKCPQPALLDELCKLVEHELARYVKFEDHW